jgi:hypothetical protein
MFAGRASWDLTPNAASARLAARRAAGLPLVDLTESNPTRCGLGAGAALLARALDELARDERALRYEPEPRGLRLAREAVAAHHAARGAVLGPDHVVLTAGTSEGYAHLFRLLGDPGDRVLVPHPSYPLFEFLAALEGLETAPYALAWSPSTGWSIDLDSLQAALTPRTRAVVLVSPHNPTGHVVDTATAHALRSLCAERGIAIVSDEVFADFATAARAPSLLRDASAPDAPLQFVLSGVSKTLALPQLKLAWIAVAGPDWLRDDALARLEVIADTYLSVNGPGQLLLPALLAGADPVQAELRARLVRNRSALAAALAPHAGLELLASGGGWSAIVRLGAGSGTPLDEEELVLRLLDDAGVFVHPGFFFDLAPETTGGLAHVVVSLLPPPEAFERAVFMLARGCADALRETRAPHAPASREDGRGGEAGA